MRVASVALLCACGRIGFDPTSGAALDDANGSGDGPPADMRIDVVLVSHDEDSDGVDDASDVCPHIADATQADGDGDNVGDACDVQPDMPAQSWRFFSPMTDVDLFDDGNTEWTQQGDAWRSRTSGLNDLRVSGAVTNIDVWIGFDIVGLGTPDRQVAILADRATGPFYYGELYDNGMPFVGISEFDGSSYSAVDFTYLGAAIPTTASGQYLRFTAQTTGALRLESMVGSTMRTNMGSAPYTGGDYLLVNISDIIVDVRYVAVVRW